MNDGVPPKPSAAPERAPSDERFHLGLLVFGLTFLSWLGLFMLFLVFDTGSPAPPFKGQVSALFVVSVFALVFLGLKFFQYSRAPLALRASLYASVLSTVLTAVCLAVSMAGPSLAEVLFGFLFAILGLLSAVFAVLRVAFRVVIQMQTRLSEWLLTLLAAGLLMAVAMALHPQTVHDDERIAYAIISMVLITFAAVAGSAWSWSLAKELGEERARYRMNLMLIGWLLVAGILSAVIFLVSIFWLAFDPGYAMLDFPALRWTVPAGFFGSFLSLPGLLIHRRAKRAAAERAHRPS
ncbi:MAG: hypothetical protein L6R28_17515 [Planctomycetes bacterium]|nr:hypothetical protein [Planctomycetota bacterium]